MSKVIFPGSFDPITYGHLDVIERVSQSDSFEEIVIGIFVNPKKISSYMFTVEERIDFIKRATSHLNNVSIISSVGLVTNYMKENNIRTIVRGIRSFKDFEDETRTSVMNKRLYDKAETFFIFTDSKVEVISSSMVKDLATFGGAINDMVPPYVEEAIMKKLNNN